MKIILDENIVSGLRNWVNGYVKTFHSDHPEFQHNIDIKREYTERVIAEIIDIGKHLGLNGHELNLAESIALFHDLGRFEQYQRYQTFSEGKSEDHAELAVEIIIREKVLGRLDEDLQKLILCSIEYHNRPFLPGEETKTCLFYSRLIRDADKLDIWRVATDYHRKSGKRNRTLELELPDTPAISPEVCMALLNKQVVGMEYVKNLNDLKLLQTGWVFDINFQPTLNCIKERRYLDLIRDVLPGSKIIDEIFEMIHISCFHEDIISNKDFS